jgi:hypothetical protein
MRKFLKRMWAVNICWDLYNGWTDPDSKGTFSLINIGSLREKWNDKGVWPPQGEMIMVGVTVCNIGLELQFSWDD